MTQRECWRARQSPEGEAIFSNVTHALVPAVDEQVRPARLLMIGSTAPWDLRFFKQIWERGGHTVIERPFTNQTGADYSRWAISQLETANSAIIDLDSLGDASDQLTDEFWEVLKDQLDEGALELGLLASEARSLQRLPQALVSRLPIEIASTTELDFEGRVQFGDGASDVAFEKVMDLRPLAGSQTTGSQTTIAQFAVRGTTVPLVLQIGKEKGQVALLAVADLWRLPKF